MKLSAADKLRPLPFKSFGCFFTTEKYAKNLFDVAEEGDAAHCPVPGADVALEVDGPDVVDVGPRRLPVDGALVQLRVLAGGRVDGVDVDHRHLLVQHLRPGLDQLPGLPVKAGALQEESCKES